MSDLPTYVLERVFDAPRELEDLDRTGAVAALVRAAGKDDYPSP